MTPILGETENGVKTIRRTLGVLPEAVIYDVDLTMSLPPRAAAASGMNAIAHAVKALCARDGSPLASLIAEAGIAAMGRSLTRIADDPGDEDARSDALYGAWP
jgi:alcohol dehydrogenase class IV